MCEGEKMLLEVLALINKIKENLKSIVPGEVKAYLVGGAVRDFLLGIPPKDFDCEFFGVFPKELELALNNSGEAFDFVGASFGVYKSKTLPLEISLPRRERKVGLTHTDFEISIDPFLSLKEAAERRDFTCNAIYYECKDNNIALTGFEDPLNGLVHLLRNQLVPCSSRFKEDPLRILRAAQFIARFEFKPSQDLINLILDSQLSLKDISKERILTELDKLLFGKKPSLGFDFLNLVNNQFPHIQALIGVQQSAPQHPEGDVYTHTMACLDAFAVDKDNYELTKEEQRIILYSILCHDFAKPHTANFNTEKNRWTFYRHEEKGFDIVIDFLKTITNEKVLLNNVPYYVKEHLRPFVFTRDKVKAKTYKKLSLRVPSLRILSIIAYYDAMGRGIYSIENKERIELSIEEFRKTAQEYGCYESPPVPFLKGEDLLSIGYKPGPVVGAVLKEIYYTCQICHESYTKETTLEVAKTMKTKWSKMIQE